MTGVSLGPPRRRRVVDARERGAEACLLAVEEGRVGSQRRGAGHEVLGRGVLLEPAHQIGDGGVVLGARDDGHVEPQPADLALDHPLQRHPHPREHLDVDGVGDAPRLRELPRGGQRVDVVAGDADPHPGGALRRQALVERAQIRGVRLLLRRVHRKLPAAQLRLHALHGEVRALDEPGLQRHAAGGDAGAGDPVQLAQDERRLGQVALHGQPRAQPQQPGLPHEPLEHLERQVEVAVFLHVEVDERVLLCCSEEQRTQPFDGGVGDGGLPPGRVLAEHRRHLDGDVVDVRAGHERRRRGEPGAGVLVAQHRLAEQVDVQGRPAAPEALQGRREGGAHVDDEVADQRPERPPHDG